jgi:hypothetical protein
MSCHSLEQEFAKANVRQYALLTVTQDVAVRRGKQGIVYMRQGSAQAQPFRAL